MIAFLKQMIEQIPIFIELKHAIDTMQEHAYFETFAIAASIITAIKLIPAIPKIIRKFKLWNY